MEVALQPADVILVRTRQEERVDIEPAVGVSPKIFEFLAKLPTDVGRFGVFVIGVRADVDIDENSLSRIGTNLFVSHYIYESTKLLGSWNRLVFC
jgi:hypothetical protein